MRMHRKLIGVLAFACLATGGSRVVQAQFPSSRPPDLPTSQLMSEGRTLYQAGRYKEAAASFERALQAGVQRPHEVAREVARSYEKLGNDKQARRWLEISLQLADASSSSGHEAARALPSSMPAPPVLACASHPAEEVQWLTRPRRTPTVKSRSRRSWTTSTI